MRALAAATVLGAGLVAAAPIPEGGSWVTLNNGVRMPQLALGTWQYDNDTAEDAVVKGYDAGFRHFMTAYEYHNQVGFGKALKTLFARGVSRKDIFVATMVPPCTVVNPTAEKCYDFTKARIEDDLQQIGVDYLDALIIHAPDTGPARGCDQLSCTTDAADYRAMDEARKAGKVRAVGVSNYCQDCIKCLLDKGYLPQLNQVQYHVGMGDDPIGLVSFQQKHGILIQAYSALCTGKLVTNKNLTEIGAAHNKTAAQVALKWLVQKGMGLLTKADDAKYLQQDFDVFSWNMTAAEQARASAEPCDPSWPSVLCNPSYACGYSFAPEPNPVP